MIGEEPPRGNTVNKPLLLLLLLLLYILRSKQTYPVSFLKVLFTFITIISSSFVLSFSFSFTVTRDTGGFNIQNYTAPKTN